MDERIRTILATDSQVQAEGSRDIAASGEPFTFEGFFQDQHAKLFRALWLVTGNRHEAEEIMQDAFLRLWERWDRVGAMADPTGYLFRTGMNVFRSRARRARVAIHKTIRSSSSEDPFSAIEERDALVRQLGELPPRQRAAIVLVDAFGMTSEEAATAMSVRPPTVRVLVGRARASLKAMEVDDE